MTYNKPEVVKLDSALKAIQGVNKPASDRPDSVLFKPDTTINAYESDE